MPRKPTPEVRAFLKDLRAYIAAQGISQREIAEHLDIPLRTLESWLGSNRTPSAMAVRALSPLLKP